MKRFLLQSLYFTRMERAGTLVLLLLCLLLYGSPALMRRLHATHAPLAVSQPVAVSMPAAAARPAPQQPLSTAFPFDPNTAPLDTLLRLGLPARTARSICHYREKGGKFRRPADFKKIFTLSEADFERLRPFLRMGLEKEPIKTADKATPVLFNFDPNMASQADLQQLGLPASAVKSILAYRSKGGIFRKKEDLKKIYTLPETAYERVAAYIAINTPAPVETPVMRPVAYQSGVLARVESRSKQPAGPVDLNGSSVAEWLSLPGIGEKRAQQILNFREKLGGFLSIDQVAETRGLPDSVFQNIRPLLVHGFAALRQINLNAATQEELDAHPYCSTKQAAQIVNYRAQHGPFQSVSELERIEAFKDKIWLERFKPYLRVQ